jgi:hypothetical protein
MRGESDHAQRATESEGDEKDRRRRVGRVAALGQPAQQEQQRAQRDARGDDQADDPWRQLAHDQQAGQCEQDQRQPERAVQTR